MTATILSAADLATELGTTGREVRKFLRSITPADAQPGKGARWGIEKKALRTLRKEFTAWAEAKAAKDAPEVAPEVAPIEAEVEGPTAEDLAAIEAEA